VNVGCDCKDVRENDHYITNNMPSTDAILMSTDKLKSSIYVSQCIESSIHCICDNLGQNNVHHNKGN
jgi:hypothetical protein